MAVLAGNTPEACIVKYGAVPLRSKACHEMALRILLRTIESHANRYGRYIKPLLSLSIDFYVRVFVRVFTGQFQCKESSTKQSMVYQCTGCEALTLQPLAVKKSTPENPKSIKFGIPTGPFVPQNCEHCSHRHHLGGPIWSDRLHDWDFLDQLLTFVKSERGQKMGTFDRILGVLSVVREELPDVPLYYTIDHLCCILKLESVPQMKMRSAILHEGFRVSLSHACKNSLKTDAPMSLLWDILRFWSKTHPVKPERFHDGTALKAILSKPSSKDYELNDIHPLANPQSRKDALSRYPENPTKMWGPGTRSTIM
jgi:tRNA (guanine26-N2/guanine27-N2)-dimethyltransferase